MGRILIGLLGLVAGLVIGAAVGGSMIAGTATGIGAATGMSAGICSTVLAATEEGLLTEQQVAQVLTRATNDLGGSVEEGQLVGSVAQCAEVMQSFTAGAAN